MAEVKDSDVIDVPVICRLCKAKKVLHPTRKGYRDWRDGTHIQNAMPEIDKGDRELLISGTCDKCWDEIFGGEEE